MAILRASACSVQEVEREISDIQAASWDPVIRVRYRMKFASVLWKPCCHRAQSRVPVTFRRPDGAGETFASMYDMAC